MKKSVAIIIMAIMLSGLFAGGAHQYLSNAQAVDDTDSPAAEDTLESQASSTKVNLNVISDQDYDVYAIRDQDDLRAVTEEIAYSWDERQAGENPEEWDPEIDHMGSEHWNVNTRAWANTTTLLTIQDYPTKAHYMEDILLS